MSDRESNIKTVLFLVIGILLLLSLVVCIFIVGQESEYVQTEAYVAEITKDAGGSGKNSVILNYDVGGTTYGYTYETKEDLNTNQKVTIFYDKKTPKYATVEKTSKIIFLFPVAGLVLCIAGLYQLFKNRGKSEDGEEQFKTSVINVVGNTQQLEIVADETEAQEYEKTHEEEIESDVKPIIKPETPIVEVELPKEAPAVEKVEVETEAPVTEPVTEVVTEPITEAPTQPVTEPVTVPAVDNVVSNPQPVVKKGINKKIIKYIFIVLILALLVVGGVFVYNFLTKEDRTETLTEISKSDKNMFMLGEEKFHIGDTVSELKKKGLSYEDNLIKDTDYIVSDSIAVYPFYYEGEAVFLGALYCPSEENCKYDDAVLIKANFYDDADVVVDETIKIGMYYDEIKDEYGKKAGKFYQDKDFYVWTFGDDGKIGEPYYLLRFNSSGRLEEIRIGVWWYEEEFEYTVK